MLSLQTHQQMIVDHFRPENVRTVHAEPEDYSVIGYGVLGCQTALPADDCSLAGGAPEQAVIVVVVEYHESVGAGGLDLKHCCASEVGGWGSGRRIER